MIGDDDVGKSTLIVGLRNLFNNESWGPKMGVQQDSALSHVVGAFEALENCMMHVPYVKSFFDFVSVLGIIVDVEQFSFGSLVVFLGRLLRR